MTAWLDASARCTSRLTVPRSDRYLDMKLAPMSRERRVEAG
jgi:hypothetical protein